MKVQSCWLWKRNKFAEYQACYLTDVNISNCSGIIANMKIGRKPPTRDAFRPSNQIQFDDDGRGYMIDRHVSREIAGTKRYFLCFFSAISLQDLLICHCWNQKSGGQYSQWRKLKVQESKIGIIWGYLLVSTHTQCLIYKMTFLGWIYK